MKGGKENEPSGPLLIPEWQRVGPGCCGSVAWFPPEKVKKVAGANPLRAQACFALWSRRARVAGHGTQVALAH